MTLDYLASIFKIILSDLVLSGDNAVVIGLAAHLLPPRQRRQAMIWGCTMAIVMRVALTLVVAHLLLFPGLQFVGAVLLAWIAMKLIQEQSDSRDKSRPPPSTLFKAITRIAMADFIMSLDNVVAIAAVSESDPFRIMLGLVLSITMLVLLSAIIMEIMSRYRWIAWAGAAVLAWTAADMMIHDFDTLYRARWAPDGETHIPGWAAYATRFIVVIFCTTTNWWRPKARGGNPSAAAAKAQPLPLEHVADPR
jgi:YjbE family integral membrane protein